MRKGLAQMMMLAYPLLLTGMGDDMFGMPTQKREKRELTEYELQMFEKLKAEKEAQQKISQGLKPFDIDGKIIWALNMKNAIRKAPK